MQGVISMQLTCIHVLGKALILLWQVHVHVHTNDESATKTCLELSMICNLQQPGLFNSRIQI